VYLLPVRAKRPEIVELLRHWCANRGRAHGILAGAVPLRTGIERGVHFAVLSEGLVFVLLFEPHKRCACASGSRTCLIWSLRARWYTTVQVSGRRATFLKGNATKTTVLFFRIETPFYFRDKREQSLGRSHSNFEPPSLPLLNVDPPRT
jgi:hypothetical protein